MSTALEDRDLDQNEHAARSSANLFQIMWQRKSLVLLGLVCGLVIGSLVLAGRDPVYQSQAQVMVIKKGPDSVMPMSAGDQRGSMMADYLESHVMVLRSPLIINRAIQSKVLNDLKTFANGEDMLGVIAYGLKVQRETTPTGTSTNVLILTFNGPVAEECPKVLQAIIEQYDKFLNEKYRDSNDKLIGLINEADQMLRVDLAKSDKELEDFHKSTHHIIDLTNGLKTYHEKLAMMDAERSKYAQKLLESEHQLESLKDIYNKHGSSVAIQYMKAIGITLTLTGDTRLDEELGKIDSAIRALRSESLGDAHPKMKVLLDERKALLERWAIRMGGEKPKAPAGAATPGAGATPIESTPITNADIIDNQARNAAVEHIRILELQVDNYRKLKDKYDAQYNALYTQLRDASAVERTVAGMRNGITMKRETHQTILKKLNELSLIKEPGGFTTTPIQPPSYGRKIAPLPYQVFTVSGVIGFLAGVGLAYLAEMGDKSFRNPAEIRRRMGLPVIGHVPFLNPNEKATQLVASGTPTLDPMLIAHYESISIGSEAYRGVRTALYFSTHGTGHQVIQVTSPNVSDGKSTLAANLAVSIAQSGKRTVILDADFRKPRVHKIFNVSSAGNGLASMVQGKATLAECVRECAVPNLSVIPCGPRPANPAELLTSPEFKRVLDEVRAAFDFVIVDTPPLLVVTDPSVVAPRVDGVVLCIRVTKNGRPYAERAKEVLASVGANVLGVVVNGFGTNATGNRYGYEHYQYGYGDYSYGYSYSYTSKDDDDVASDYYNAPKEEGASGTAAPATGS